MSSKPKKKRVIKCQHCVFKGNQHQIGLHYKSKPAHAPPRVQRRMGYQTDGQERNEARVTKGGKAVGRPLLAHNGPSGKRKQYHKDTPLTAKGKAISRGLKRFHTARRAREQATSHTPIQVQDLAGPIHPSDDTSSDLLRRLPDTRTGAWNYCPRCGLTLKEQMK